MSRSMDSMWTATGSPPSSASSPECAYPSLLGTLVDVMYFEQRSPTCIWPCHFHCLHPRNDSLGSHPPLQTSADSVQILAGLIRGRMSKGWRHFGNKICYLSAQTLPSSPPFLILGPTKSWRSSMMGKTSSNCCSSFCLSSLKACSWFGSCWLDG